MEEDINNLIYTIEMHHISSKPIFDLMARNKELEKEYKWLYEDSMKQWEERCRMAIELDYNVIPKSKIKEKIEELYERDWVLNEIRDVIIESLEELLEEN